MERSRALLDETITYFLNPLVYWIGVGGISNRVQIRSPDGRHITIDQNSADAVAFLQIASAGFRFEDLEHGFERELAILLLDRSFLSLNKPGTLSYSDRLLEFQAEIDRAEGLKDFGEIGRIEVLGEGAIAGAVKNIVPANGVSTPLLALSQNEATLTIACSDYPAHDFFRDTNAKLFSSPSNGLLTFVYLDGPRVIIGPCVYPGVSACFECLHSRMFGNAIHHDETLAAASQPPSFTSLLSEDDFVIGFARHVIKRHVLGLIENSDILNAHDGAEVFDVLNFSREVVPALRLSKCPVCSPSFLVPNRMARDVI